MNIFFELIFSVKMMQFSSISSYNNINVHIFPKISLIKNFIFFSIDYTLWIWKKYECVLIRASHVKFIKNHLKMVMSLTTCLFVSIQLSYFKKGAFLLFSSHVYLQPHRCHLNQLFFLWSLRAWLHLFQFLLILLHFQQ